MDLVTLGTILVVVGVLLLITATLFSLAKSGSVRNRGGAVVIVGPFPIIFGSDKHSAKMLLLLSISLVVVLIVLFLLQIL